MVGLFAAFWLVGSDCRGADSSDSSSVRKQITTAAKDTQKAIEDAGQAAVSNMESLWQRIDEQRLKNRTRDELVAWVLMGLLVGGLLFRLGRLKPLTALLLGLIGAFIGGIAAHVGKINLGLGPVLIRYEDLLCSLLGGVSILLVARWFTSKRQPTKT